MHACIMIINISPILYYADSLLAPNLHHTAILMIAGSHVHVDTYISRNWRTIRSFTIDLRIFLSNKTLSLIQSPWPTLVNTRTLNSYRSWGMSRVTSCKVRVVLRVTVWEGNAEGKYCSS